MRRNNARLLTKSYGSKNRVLQWRGEVFDDPDGDVVIPRRLLGSGGVPEADVPGILEAVRTTGQPVRVLLERLGLVQQKAWAEAAAHEADLPLVTLDQMPAPLPSDDRLSEAYLKRNSIAPLEIGEGQARFAVADPFNDQAFAALKMLFGDQLTLAVATDGDIETALGRGPEIAEDTTTEANETAAAAQPLDLDASRLKELANNAPTVKYLNQIFANAVEMRATDIHVEMLAGGPRVRVRVDGDLVQIAPPDRELYSGILSRLKILADMDISERRLPQDGRIRQKLSGRDIDMRVASTPTIHGESIVLRLLDSGGAPNSMDALQMPKKVASIFRKSLQQPNGLILVTGPTGSGKTTTLHAALNSIKNTRRKIVTIENPVEIQSAGLQQIEVNPDLGWTFAAALRTVLRHDPDILMVGEIRDSETAELAVRAAMTGHLVLSTLHTNRAIDAPLRMIDMGIPDYLLTSVLRMSAAQRLVRKLCSDCAVPKDVSGSDRSAALFEKLAKLDPSLGPVSDWTPKQSVGCDICSGTGFHGRFPVFEALDADLITKLRAAPHTRYRSMWAEGMRHVAEGRTTVQEITRVLGTEGLWT